MRRFGFGRSWGSLQVGRKGGKDEGRVGGKGGGLMARIEGGREGGKIGSGESIGNMSS
jgi:hypothetical protein